MDYRPELSEDLFVTDCKETPLVRLIDDELMGIYGVHQMGAPSYMWMWNPVGNPKPNIEDILGEAFRRLFNTDPDNDV